MLGSIRRVATVVAAFLFVGLSVSAATAQMKLNMPTRGSGDQKTEQQRIEEEQKKKVLEEAYQKAGKTIPEPKARLDPWKNAR